MSELIPLSKWMKLPREIRIAHIDKTTPCEIDLSVSAATRRRRGTRALNELLGIERDIPNLNKYEQGSIHYSHLCDCDSTKGWCSNPLHGYWSWQNGENFGVDMSEESKERRRKGDKTKGGKKGGKASGTMKWICADGYVANAGNCGQHLKSIGFDKSLRWEVPELLCPSMQRTGGLSGMGKEKRKEADQIMLRNLNVWIEYMGIEAGAI